MEARIVDKYHRARATRSSLWISPTNFYWPFYFFFFSVFCVFTFDVLGYQEPVSGSFRLNYILLLRSCFCGRPEEDQDFWKTRWPPTLREAKAVEWCRRLFISLYQYTTAIQTNLFHFFFHFTPSCRLAYRTRPLQLMLILVGSFPLYVQCNRRCWLRIW